MKIYALICHKLDLTQFWPKVVSWRFEITNDVLPALRVILPHEDPGVKFNESFMGMPMSIYGETFT